MSQNGNAVLAAAQESLVCGETMFWFAERIVVLRDSMSLFNICNGSGLNGEQPLGICEKRRISRVVGVSGKVRQYNFVTTLG
jgi:hypothetical protein